MAAISFKFSKSSKKPVLNIVKSSNEKENSDQDRILSIEDKQIESATPKVEKKELVIPLIKQNKWRTTGDDSAGFGKSEEALLEEKAAAEILAETAHCNENWENRNSSRNDNLEIPLIMRNMVPEGFETDEKLDVSLRPNVSSLDDYEDVPIEHFGIAILRGMGWKKDEGIGGKNKQVIKPIEAVVRPKGLGLGADPKLVQKFKSGETNGENLDYKINSYVRVVHGPHRDLYGQIIGLDEDNSRVNVKMTLSGKLLTLSKFTVIVVSKKEYKKESKVINQEKYKEYVKKKDEENRESSKRRYNGVEMDDESHSKKKKKKHKESRMPLDWILPSLKVRFVDKKYHHGKYYGTKVIIEDVVSAHQCIGITESGRMLSDLHPNQLETIVPKNEDSHVMVVSKGPHHKKVGRLLNRDKSKMEATVQFYDDHSLAKLHFDCVCEYVGDVSNYS